MLKITIEICDKNNITYYCQAGTVLGVIRHGGQIPWDHDADIIIPDNQIERFVKCATCELPSKYSVDYYDVNGKQVRLFPRIGLKGYHSNELHLDVFRLMGIPDERKKQLEHMNKALAITKKYKLKKRSIISVLKHCEWVNLLEKIKLYFVSLESISKSFNYVTGYYDYDKSNYVMNPSGKYREKNIFNKKVYGDGCMKLYNDFQVRIPAEWDFYLHQYYGNYMQIPSNKSIKRELDKVFTLLKIQEV